MLEILEFVVAIAWLILFVLLVAAESWFCIQLHELVQLYKKYKKEKALSSNNGYNGHPGRLIKDIKMDLDCLKVEIISWACIAIAGAYVILDCFITHII